MSTSAEISPLDRTLEDDAVRRRPRLDERLLRSANIMPPLMLIGFAMGAMSRRLWPATPRRTGAAFFASGAVISALLFRRRGQGLSLAHTPDAASEQVEPTIAH